MRLSSASARATRRPAAARITARTARMTHQARAWAGTGYAALDSLFLVEESPVDAGLASDAAGFESPELEESDGLRESVT
jgi:hypothetical protein